MQQHRAVWPLMHLYATLVNAQSYRQPRSFTGPTNSLKKNRRYISRAEQDFSGVAEDGR